MNKIPKTFYINNVPVTESWDRYFGQPTTWMVSRFVPCIVCGTILNNAEVRYLNRTMLEILKYMCIKVTNSDYIGVCTSASCRSLVELNPLVYDEGIIRHD